MTTGKSVQVFIRTVLILFFPQRPAYLRWLALIAKLTQPRITWEGGASEGECLHGVGLWMCVWRVVLIKFIDVRRPSLLWAALIPRQRVLD